MSRVTRLPFRKSTRLSRGYLCCYAVADVDNTPLFRKGLSNSLLTQQRCSIAAKFWCRSKSFFQILPPRSAAPASSVGGHYWRQMVPEFMQSADSSL